MDKSTIIRINSIQINNIKNVVNGKVDLNKTAADTRGSSIVGLYGQNGSGKTALVWAVEALKTALSGEKFSNALSYYILAGEKTATISVDFLIKFKDREYNVFYEFVIAHDDNGEVYVAKESLDYSAKATEKFEKINKASVLNIEVDNHDFSLSNTLYGPDVRIRELGNRDKGFKQKLIVLQALAKNNNVSYIFNDGLFTLLNEGFSDTIYFSIIDALRYYARFNLFVLNKNSEMGFNMNILPLSIRLIENNSISKCDAIPIGLYTNSVEPKMFTIIEKVISQIDILMGKIVPGLNIEIINVEKKLDEKGNEKVSFELISNRNETKTPLRYESEGIKKILGILSALIAMYNDKSVFVAIDELDSGVFEYLLGEILLVIKNTGKGQLLFTSHNMRPLEVLDNSNIYFTTTNPKNKYIQFTGIKNNNNLRNTLLRTIDLGGQKEDIYENTNSYQIGKAFRKAGECINGAEEQLEV